MPVHVPASRRAEDHAPRRDGDATVVAAIGGVEIRVQSPREIEPATAPARRPSRAQARQGRPQPIRQLLGQALGDSCRQLPQLGQFPLGERPAKGEDLFEQFDRRPTVLGSRCSRIAARPPAAARRAPPRRHPSPKSPLHFVNPFPCRRRCRLGPAAAGEVVSLAAALAGTGTVQLIERGRGAVLPLHCCDSLSPPGPAANGRPG